MVSVCILLGCVSLLKSQSRFLILKQIFCSFTKIQKWIIDPKDPQWRWILKRVNTASGTYVSCLIILLIFTVIYEPDAWIVQSIFFLFYHGGKIAIQN